MPPEPARPLAGWSFDGTLRAYQAAALRRVDVDAGEPLHLVAPPGSGKTLLGLLLAARRGRRTVVFAPTIAIREQWVGAARALAHDDTAVSEDPAAPADLTALTYQSISVLDSASPFAALARERWRDELKDDDRTPEAATVWLDALSESNPSAYRRGIQSRARAIRRSLARQDATVLAAALHPNARELIDRLVARGVETIVLDECHHLLDHWALVVAALLARIRADGRDPLVIGLTATLPTPDDADEYDNYISLLGEVDLEVPVPAVVREGDLAPYRELVHVVEPTAEERLFLSAHAQALEVALRTSFAVGSGRASLLGILKPVGTADADADDIDHLLAAAFAADFAGAEAAGAMLSLVAPDDPVVAHLPAFARRPPTTDETLRLLGRFALDHVLPDPSRAEEWTRLRTLLADFGYALTDRGVRRTRDPIDSVLTSSLAKDQGACDILAAEAAALGERLCALVVTDFARHGNVHGGLLGAAGAVRTFSVLTTDAATADLRAMLVTSSTVRLARRDAAELLAALVAELGVEVTAAPVDDDPHVVEVRGIAGAGIVGAAARLLSAGRLQVVVGTRGLFGEGWDCPRVNTLVDLTAAAGDAAMQQLRGRTLRLDPAWPEKTAHNWTVTALVPTDLAVEAQPDATRLRRKHARLWGVDVDDPRRVVRGIGAALGHAQRRALTGVLSKAPGAASAGVGALDAIPSRATTRELWRIGEPYEDVEEESFVVEHRPHVPLFPTSVSATRETATAFVGTLGASGAAIAGAFALVPDVAPPFAGAALLGGALTAVPLGIAWRQGRRRVRDARATLHRIVEVLWAALADAGRVRAAAGAPSVIPADALTAVHRLEVVLRGAEPDDRAAFGQALIELCAPVRAPRFVLEVDRGGRSAVVGAVLRLAGSRRPRRFLAVPADVGRRREVAHRFAQEWQRRIGPVTLHEVGLSEGDAVISEARRSGAFSGAARSLVWWR
ncbi:DNA or RNA helicase of superfamily II [Microbacterium testaceum StLB037]|uniref:DNA or RNA helicase of superfamily II n=1 Tax=Microbacterium testaceum (strain StLB037) TaxID=979556 RepID=E8N7D6_MICTS|nr:DEAD/DEAH box helicase family protein [Microbacterium testaceum]BAJ72969.1 DNA or RNA helicase of superfamily II [Microbacterium testaceum StLB037]